MPGLDCVEECWWEEAFQQRNAPMEPHVPVSATCKQRLFLLKDFASYAGMLQTVGEGKTSTSYSKPWRAPVSQL